MKNLKNKCVLTLVFALGTFLLSGCFQSKNSIIRVCYPTKKLIKKSVEYTDHIPLTAHRLRNMLENDTTHYKIVVIYSVCCGPCNVKMENVYAPMYKSLDTSVCRMYFVLDDCGSLPWNADYMAQYGVKDLYYLRDDDPMFHENMRLKHRQTNIINYATQPKAAFTSVDGVPITLIIDPKGRVKQLYTKYSNGTGYMSEYSLDMLKMDSLTVQNLNYEKIDTISVGYEYTKDISNLDTVSFRTYKPIPRPAYCTPDGKCY